MLKIKSPNKVQKINRTDIFSKRKRSEIMSHVRSKESKIEKRIGKILWAQGLRYRKNVRSMFGNPDFVMKKHKIAVFVDSCFWHGCKKHGSYPKTNRSFWARKIFRNKERDLEVNRHYRKTKWKVLRIWEHEIKRNPDFTIKKIIKFLEK